MDVVAVDMDVVAVVYGCSSCSIFSSCSMCGNCNKPILKVLFRISTFMKRSITLKNAWLPLHFML